MIYIIAFVEELTPAEMIAIQKDLEEVRSIVGEKSKLVQMMQEVLDNAERIL